jgi:DNA (cytosine-5)-methyltransferase 1
VTISMVDLFCGAGGANVGTHLALDELGIAADQVNAHAVNHWDLAVAVHGLNMPWISVHQEDITRVSAKTYRLRDIDLLFAAPSCVHHSRARGGKPRSDQQRSHAWEVLERWIESARVKVFLMENVPEFLDWGPLDRDQQPLRPRKGEYFRAFVRRLRCLGYQVDWRVLCAADYGDPTTRRRFFLQAVADGREIVWPEPTHRDPRKPGNEHLPPWRSAAECIDWSLPCPSIFTRKRPLADATMRRIAAGVAKFVLQGKPFLVTCNHRDDSFRGQGADEPMRTVTAAHEARGLVVPSVAPFIANFRGTDPSQVRNGASGMGEPLKTVTAGANHHALVTPFIAGLAHGAAHDGHQRRCKAMGDPLTTIHAGGNNHAIVAPCLIQTSYGERKGQAPRVLDLERPLGTVVAGGQKHGLVAALLSKHYGGPGALEKQPPGLRPSSPMGTVTAQDKHSLVTVDLGTEADHGKQVAAFLMHYYSHGGQGQRVDLPMHTVTTIQRHGLVMAEIDGASYVITDIGLRMLEPHELARAMGFPAWYRWERADGTPLSKRDAVKMIGNACPVGTVKALIKAVVLQRPLAFGLEAA